MINAIANTATATTIAVALFVPTRENKSHIPLGVSMYIIESMIIAITAKNAIVDFFILITRQYFYNFYNQWGVLPAGFTPCAFIKSNLQIFNTQIGYIYDEAKAARISKTSSNGCHITSSLLC